MRAFLIAAAVAGVMVSAATVGFGQAKPAGTPSIEGAWKGVSTVTTGANASSNPNRLPSIVIYTKTHYSVVVQDADVPLQPRKAVPAPKDPNRLTDAEKIARYELWLPVGAQSGTYEVKGKTLTQHQLVSKGYPPVDQTFEVEFKDNTTMVQIAKSAPGQPVSETRRTYTRLE